MLKKEKKSYRKKLTLIDIAGGCRNDSICTLRQMSSCIFSFRFMHSASSTFGLLACPQKRSVFCIIHTLGHQGSDSPGSQCCNTSNSQDLFILVTVISRVYLQMQTLCDGKGVQSFRSGLAQSRSFKTKRRTNRIFI